MIVMSGRVMVSTVDPLTGATDQSVAGGRLERPQEHGGNLFQNLDLVEWCAN
jgi:hypothetical protein